LSLRRHASRIVNGLDPQVRQVIWQAPMSALRQLGLAAHHVQQLVNQRGEGGWCDGVSFLDEGVILYSPTQNSRRENFTVTHEIAHWLVDSDDDALDWIADSDDAGRLLEQLCDHIAGLLLVPDELVTTVIGDGPLRAAHVRALYDGSQTSEPACAIALARQLHAIEAVVIVDRATSNVEYASISWNEFEGKPIAYPWPGQTVPDGHVLHRLTPGGGRTTRSWWATPWGEQHDYYLDAIAGQNRIHAVFSELDLWHVQAIHFDRPARRVERPTRELSCRCGFTGTVTGYPHDDCDKPFCPKCGACGCTRAIAMHRRCRKCTVLSPPADLVEEVCSMCR
jgi:hypothetical protein